MIIPRSSISSHWRGFRGGIFLALLVILGGAAEAQFTDWQDPLLPGDRDWADPNNWTGGVPGGANFSRARIDAGVAEVRTPGQGTGFGLTIGDFVDAGLVVTGGGSLLNYTNPFFLPAEVIVASALGSSGDVSITGSGSQWIADADFYLGWGGDAVLSIDSSGRLDTDRFA